MRILLLFILVSFSFSQVIDVPDKSDRDSFTAAEFNQILDAIKHGTTHSLVINDSLNFVGDGKFWRGRGLELHLGYAVGKGVPTRVDNINGGLGIGYSMPVAGADEVLYFRGKSSRMWDSITNFQIRFLICLASPETAGETFKFDLSWQHQDVGDVMPSSVVATYSDSNVVVAGRGAAYNIYYLYYDIALGDLKPNEMFNTKLDRVASSGDQVDGEIIILHWISVWLCNRVGTDSDW